MAKGGQTPPEPGSEHVRAAWARKDAGDVSGARRDAQRILADSPSPEDRERAEDLLRATQTPRALYGYALLGAVILAVLLGLALTRYS
ncbi:MULTISPECIES: molecular chaperone DnaJ [unclassified Corallococcus]|uniref:molecular chaperone DnaJ n=1 Tax=unclassified Corallococcus TaxID=2685029 RepID=UPI001A8F34B0|nr:MULTISPECIES: molecular chaperone DnaJ [unclassified Corallococcus]MBN9683037.1 molecular chaperone DnaJ [Corallococcus sp. NCSPR001]WAS85429.1 molecular chaperone DnaJ [Corallococcus sp. NCRR]